MSLLSLTVLCSVLVVAGQSFACAVSYESSHAIKQSPYNSFNSNSFKTAGDASLLKDDQQFPKSNSAEPGNLQKQPPRKTPKPVQPRIHGISTPPAFHSPNSDLLNRPPGLNGQNSDLYYRGPGIENQNLHRNFGSGPLDKQGLTPQHFNPQQRLHQPSYQGGYFPNDSNQAYPRYPHQYGSGVPIPHDNFQLQPKKNSKEYKPIGPGSAQRRIPGQESFKGLGPNLLYYSPEYYRQQSQPGIYRGMRLPSQKDGSKTSPKSKRKTDF